MTEVTANDLVVTKAQAKELAVRYSAFIEAMRTADDLGMVIWGDMLNKSQDETGIALMDAENTSRMVGYARARRLEAEKAKEKETALCLTT